jgi:lipoprotein-anchoring transpeptidase ErfK/SrfK
MANTEADIETFVDETFIEERVIAPIVAHVDISEQRMVLEVDGEALHEWPVSTARPGKETPTGVFDVEWLSAKHRSSLYNNAPMPWSIFYDGDYAIHGTTDVAALGTPASAGCVRLHPENAKILFKMVTKRGYDSLKVVIND